MFPVGSWFYVSDGQPYIQLLFLGVGSVWAEAAGCARGDPAQPGREEPGGELLGPHGPSGEGAHEALHRQPPLQHYGGHA